MGSVETMFRMTALAVCAALLLVAGVVRLRTPVQSTDRAVRTDVLRLLSAVLLGQLIELQRSRLPLGAVGFWLLSLLMLPIVGIVLFYLGRIYGAYRQLEPGKINAAKPGK